MKIKAKRLSNTAIIPTYGSKRACAADIYCDLRVDKCIDLNPANVDFKHMGYSGDCFDRVHIAPHETIKLPTGWAFQPPEGYAGFIYARSGLSTKNGLRPANCLGVCDEDYRAEYIVALHNDTDEVQTIHNGDRIAQLEFRPYEQSEFELVDELDKTERGLAGFGSTGV